MHMQFVFNIPNLQFYFIFIFIFIYFLAVYRVPIYSIVPGINLFHYHRRTKALIYS